MTCFNCEQSFDYKTRLGRTTWKFLELLFEGYPFNPDDYEKEAMKNLIISLSRAYPCIKCRPGFIDFVQKNEPFFNTKKQIGDYFNKLKKYINAEINK